MPIADSAAAGSFRRSVSALASSVSMHHIEPASVALPRSQSSSYVPCVTFVTDQKPYMSPRMDSNLIRLQEQRRFYYGIEVLATNKDKPVCLDFHRFLPVLPIFVSIAWLGGKYSSVDPIEQVDSLVLAKHLAPHIHVMPHFTAHRLTEKRLDAFLAQGFSNMLALRGDAVHQGQLYNDSIPILQKAKGGKSKRESISVFVAGHPEGYYTPGVGFSNMETHIKILKDKIRSEASGIITQMCYEAQTIINFVKRIRSDRAIAETPILVGIMIHEDFQAYERIVNLNGVRLPKLLSEELEKLAKQDDGSPHRVRDFFIHLNVHIIRQIMNADIGVYGFQFFTLNNFEAVEATLEELRHQKILSGKEYELPKTNLTLMEV